MDAIERYLSEKRDEHLEELKEFLRIPSVSTLPEHKDDIVRCANLLADKLRNLGFEHVSLLETEGHPVVYGDWLHAEGKPTVLVYGHYDVQPVDPLHLWKTPPFEPDVREGNIYARGSSDDKGQVFMHLKAFEALLAVTGTLPVNVKICFEGEEEIGSRNLPRLLEQRAEVFSADLLVISDTAMWSHMQPSVCVGLRGLVSLQIDVKGANSDLHSGSYGGVVQNPIHALVQLLNSMRDEDGTITIDGFYNAVLPITVEEKKTFAALGLDDDELARFLDVPSLFGEKGYTTIEREWSRPTLEINGIYGGFQGEGTKTVLPNEAHAKITCRLVPDQNPEEIHRLIAEHVKQHTPPGVTIHVKHMDSGHPYVAPLDHPAVRLAAEVYERYYGTPAIFTRTGGSIPIVADFARLLEIPVVMMGFAHPDDNIHAPNEKFSLDGFDKGIRTLCFYWRELDHKMAEDRA